MKKGIQPEWDESPTLVPPRTRLYQLDPIGHGTAMVECLSSYIHRLAEAHGLPTWVLVCRELAPQFRRMSILASNGHCDLFGNLGMTINGNNDTAREAIGILHHLTGQTELSFLTFCRLGSLVAEHRILHRAQVWCPECLEQWRKSGNPVYQPLIWTLSPLKTCPTHGCSLEDRCPECGRGHVPLGRYRWNGLCPRCSSWLGKARRDDRPRGKPSVSAWHAFVAGALARFMVDLQSLPDGVPRATFASNVMDLVRNRFGGNYSALARALRIHRSTAFDWANGKHRPAPASLVALAYCFGGEAMDWIIGRPSPAQTHDTRPIEPMVSKSMRRPLRRHRPEIVRAHLSSAMHSAELPPPSLTAICKQLGVNQTVAKRLCPDLAAKIMSRYRLFRAEGKRTRETFRKTVVESAVNQLLAEGLTLSYNQLSKVLPPGVTARDRLVRCEFQRLRAESAIG